MTDVMRFVAKMIARKRVRTCEIALVAGSIHNVKPTLHDKQLRMRVVRPSGDLPGQAAGIPAEYRWSRSRQVEGPVARFSRHAARKGLHRRREA